MTNITVHPGTARLDSRIAKCFFTKAPTSSSGGAKSANPLMQQPLTVIVGQLVMI